VHAPSPHAAPLLRSLYERIVTEDFTRANPLALDGIYNTWLAIEAAGATPAGRAAIEEGLGICKGQIGTMDDVYGVEGWLQNAIGFAAMADYPYPANFLGAMPAFPCSVMAQAYAKANGTLAELLSYAREGIATVFYNYTGEAGPCFNLTQSDSPAGLQGDGWGVQCCHEVVQPIGSYGPPNDFFLPSPFNESAFIEGCQLAYNGTTPRPTCASSIDTNLAHRIPTPTHLSAFCDPTYMPCRTHNRDCCELRRVEP